MAPLKLDLHNPEDCRDHIHLAVAALASGKIIAFPTETVYGLAVSALAPSAVVRLAEIKGRDGNKPFAFAVQSLEASLDYVPDMSPLAKRLARRCWPGPVTLVVDCQHRDSVVNRLDPTVKQLTIPQGRVGLRVPANDKALQIMQLCAGPILLTSANLAGEPDAINSQQVLEGLGDKVDLVLDDGPCRIGQPSSVVYVGRDSWEILKPGVVDQGTLQNLSGFVALVVCTGNTCRSPMGEALLRKKIAEKIGAPLDQLDRNQIQVLSGGISAMPGAPAAAAAMQVMQERGLDISEHTSQPITGRMAQAADLILCMTEQHRQALVNHWPSLENRTFTLRADGGNISDPIGAPLEVYRQCADQIETELSYWMEKIDFRNGGFKE
jgi:tRNA threonylcarbamoyl adenosine modification protein (Sua5/YciO/YrdC/YwlC family)